MKEAPYHTGPKNSNSRKYTPGKLIQMNVWDCHSQDANCQMSIPMKTLLDVLLYRIQKAESRDHWERMLDSANEGGSQIVRRSAHTLETRHQLALLAFPNWLQQQGENFIQIEQCTIQISETGICSEQALRTFQPALEVMLSLFKR